MNFQTNSEVRRTGLRRKILIRWIRSLMSHIPEMQCCMLPVDVTPGYYYDTAELQNMVNTPDNVRKNAALKDNCLGLDAYLGWNTKETDSHLEEFVRETTDS